MFEYLKQYIPSISPEAQLIVGLLLAVMLILLVLTLKAWLTKKSALEDSKFFEGRSDGLDKANERMTKSMGQTIDKLTNAVINNNKNSK